MTKTFKTFEEACDWFKAGQAKHGKRAFTATEEYRAGYASFAKLSKERRAIEREESLARKAKCDELYGKPVNLLAHAMRGA